MGSPLIDAATSQSHATLDRITATKLKKATRLKQPSNLNRDLSAAPTALIAGINTINRKANPAAKRIDPPI